MMETARNAALEEAKNICEAVGHAYKEYKEGAYQCRLEILALQSAPAQPVEKLDVKLPERVIDTLWQRAGLSTYHPDGDQLEKLHNFAHLVKNEVLARMSCTIAANQPQSSNEGKSCA